MVGLRGLAVVLGLRVFQRGFSDSWGFRVYLQLP